MFNLTSVRQIEALKNIEIEELKRKHKNEIQDIERKKKFETEDIIKSYEKELEEASRPAEQIKQELEKAHQLELQEKDYTIMSLEANTKTLESEVKMLRTAFESLGFDVKDMKDILGKLVDGLIAKNEIKILNNK